MNNAKLGVTKYQNSFTSDKGETIIYESLEIEIAPNLCANISLKPQNQRVLQKYAPDMYQLVTNIPHGHQVVFEQHPETYKKDENATDFIAN